jgi:predicted transposase/invertase (TIGR01784 family)
VARTTPRGSGIPLTSDFVFKYVFGSEGSTTILRSLLSAVLEDAGYSPVTSVEIRNPFNEKDAQETKLSIVDVRARDITGAVYSVEMQAYNHKGFFPRVL